VNYPKSDSFPVLRTKIPKLSPLRHLNLNDSIYEAEMLKIINPEEPQREFGGWLKKEKKKEKK
jgi:hypothetical protein